MPYQQVQETRRHRCLRAFVPGLVSCFRAQLDDQPQCRYLQLIDKVQRVFLDIQLAAPRPDFVPNPDPNDPDRSRPSSGHPECVIKEDRLICRPGRNSQRSHATSERQFWERRCYANLGGVHLRAVARSVAVWNKTKAEHPVGW
jgi:hypothetical protein